MKRRIFSVAASCLCISSASAAVLVGDSSTLWTALDGNYDFVNDQQTGQASGDIVGSAEDPGFFTTFESNGAASATDGTMGFRLRLDAVDGPTNKPDFDRVAWIGIDADINGSIDVFLGLNLQGSSAEIGIHAPGSGANTSPNTTSIVSRPVVSYALTSANYNYRPVSHLADGGTTNDVTTATSGDPDYYVSFMLPFADVAAFLAGRSIHIDDTSPLRYVLATSTQTNSLNQDLGGVNGGTNSATTWADLGGFSKVITADGRIWVDPVPEPGPAGLLALAAGGLLSVRRRAC